MRKPTLQDILTLSKIIKKIGVEEFKKIDTSKDIEEIGKDVFFHLLSKVDVIEDDFFHLISSICEITVDEARNISVDEIPKLFDEIKRMPGLSDFFTRASALTK